MLSLARMAPSTLVKKIPGALVALVAGVLTLVGGYTLAKGAYERTIGLKNRLYEQLSLLSVNTQVEYFSQILGTAQIKNVSPVLDEYIFASRYFYVQAVANKDGKVLFYSVTTRRKDFTPAFHEEGAFQEKQSNNFRSFNVGADKFSSLEEEPSGIAGFSGAHNFAYVELYYFGNPAKYQWFFFIFNEAGYFEQSELDPLVDLVGTRFNGELKLGEFASKQPFDLEAQNKLSSLFTSGVFSKLERSLTINGYGVASQDFELARYADPTFMPGEGLIFGPKLNDVRILKDVPPDRQPRM